jgi:hypothetical protein
MVVLARPETESLRPVLRCPRLAKHLRYYLGIAMEGIGHGSAISCFLRRLVGNLIAWEALDAPERPIA